MRLERLEMKMGACEWCEILTANLSSRTLDSARCFGWADAYLATMSESQPRPRGTGSGSSSDVLRRGHSSLK
jgi:hypothetical protein